MINLKRKALALFVPAMLVGGTLLYGHLSGETTKRGLPDPLALFADRSPGSRGEGALLQTKKKAQTRQLASAKPTERVLSNVRTPPPALNPTGAGDAPFAGSDAPQLALNEPMSTMTPTPITFSPSQLPGLPATGGLASGDDGALSFGPGVTGGGGLSSDYARR